jgi:hypothetical protein
VLLRALQQAPARSLIYDALSFAWNTHMHHTRKVAVDASVQPHEPVRASGDSHGHVGEVLALWEAGIQHVVCSSAARA